MPEGEVNARAVFVHTGFVMFLNWNSYFLEMNEIHAGETPEYTGETPVRESTAEYDYIFTGWEPEISPMPEDEVFVTYTAVYSSRPRNYAVIFTGADGTPLQIDQYPYGSTPEYTEETPVRAADEHYSYRFLRWEPEIGPVTETTVYTAVFDATPILHEGENPLSLTMYEPKICPFTPAQTGYYRIYTVGEEIHPDLIITDETGKRLIMGEDERLKWWNINTDGIMNFEYLVSLEGGKTYGMKLEAGFASGEISVFVERVDMIPIHYDPEMEHGTVEGPAEAWEGQLIDFYARGDDGYGMVRMTVRDESGELFRIEDPDRQLYGYYMPDSEVYVSCEFAPAYPVTADIGEHILFSMDSAIRQDFDDEGGWMLSAAEGALLEFRLELDDRCALDTLSVTSPRGDVEFNTYQKDLYEYDLWFTMPAEPVTLTAGAVTTACMVTFDPGEGSGTMDPVTAETGKPFELPWCEFTEPDMKIFIAWQIGDDTQNLRNPEETVILEGDTTLTAVWYPVSMLFGISELPEDLIHIQPEAFEGSAVSVVWLPDSCTSIGAYAFRNCKYLLAIRIPEGCSLGTGVFDGCPMVFVYGKTGSAAERYCNEHGNCHFESED